MTEFRLWRFMTDVNDEGDWGNRPIPPETRESLRRLSERAGGWIYWNSDADVSSDKHGPTFVIIAEWTKIYEAWSKGQEELSEGLPRRYSDLIRLNPEPNGGR